MYPTASARSASPPTGCARKGVAVEKIRVVRPAPREMMKAARRVLIWINSLPRRGCDGLYAQSAGELDPLLAA
jgi:hypothetical protein